MNVFFQMILLLLAILSQSSAQYPNSRGYLESQQLCRILLLDCPFDLPRNEENMHVRITEERNRPEIDISIGSGNQRSYVIPNQMERDEYEKNPNIDRSEVTIEKSDAVSAENIKRVTSSEGISSRQLPKAPKWPKIHQEETVPIRNHYRTGLEIEDCYRCQPNQYAQTRIDGVKEQRRPPLDSYAEADQIKQGIDRAIAFEVESPREEQEIEEEQLVMSAESANQIQILEEEKHEFFAIGENLSQKNEEIQWESEGFSRKQLIPSVERVVEQVEVPHPSFPIEEQTASESDLPHEEPRPSDDRYRTPNEQVSVYPCEGLRRILEKCQYFLNQEILNVEGEETTCEEYCKTPALPDSPSEDSKLFNSVWNLFTDSLTIDRFQLRTIAGNGASSFGETSMLAYTFYRGFHLFGEAFYDHGEHKLCAKFGSRGSSFVQCGDFRILKSAQHLKTSGECENPLQIGSSQAVFVNCSGRTSIGTLDKRTERVFTYSETQNMREKKKISARICVQL